MLGYPGAAEGRIAVMSLGCLILCFQGGKKCMPGQGRLPWVPSRVFTHGMRKARNTEAGAKRH